VADPTPRAPLVSYHGGHTLYDGAGTPEQFVEAAIRQGFTALGFSEHMPAPARYPYPDHPPWDAAARMFDGYVEEITRLRSQYANELPILLGVETEYLPDEETYMTDFLAQYPFEYVVGSVHYVAGIGFDYSREWYDRAVAKCGGYEELACEYYRCMRSLLELDITDVLGHLDVINIFAPGPITGPAVTDAEDETLAMAKKHNVVLDVNGRGLIKPCKQIYPRVELLGRARTMGVPATLGDDSHAPEQVGARLDEAREVMRGAGYTSVTALLTTGEQIQRRELPL
jgi:histidinol-phosphatase (PHP family)